MSDRHVRRTADDYGTALLGLLPTGPAWPRDEDAVLVRTARALAAVFGYVDSRAADLLERESDPRQTLELLPDWERNFGLPDPCFFHGEGIDLRRKALLRKMTIQGGQSRAFFIAVAAELGYTITITEYSPFMCGISRCGDTRNEAGEYRWQIGAPEMRFYWTVHVANASLTWFRSARGEAGVDPHLRIGMAVDLECILRRWKPAHTDVVFDYSGLGLGDPLAGTP